MLYIKVQMQGRSPHLHGGLQYLKYYIEIEKKIPFSQINQKWLNIDAAMND
jgi:hypothetical protein